MGTSRRFILLLAIILISALPAQAQRSAESSHVVQAGETLGHIAQQYGVSLYQLAALNDIGNAHLIYTWQRLTLPAGAAPAQAALPASGAHTVQRGETLDSIAKLYGINLFELQRANNIFNAWIYPGDVLALPGHFPDPDAVVTEQDGPETQTTETAPDASGETHIVRPGDTLANIAAQYGVSLYDLQALNNNYTDWIFVGEELLLPDTVGEAAPRSTEATPAADTAAPGASEYTHVVRFGETLGTIAVAYGVSLFDLQASNDIWSYLIYPGQELVIPAGGTPPEEDFTPPEQAPAPQAPANRVQRNTHTVQRGETLFGIAAQYNVPVDLLMSANGIADPRYLHSGLVLRVKDLESASPPQPAASTNAAPASAIDERGPRAVRRAAGRVPVDDWVKTGHELAGNRGD